MFPIKIAELPAIIKENAYTYSMRVLEELAGFNNPEDALIAFDWVQKGFLNSNDLRKIRRNMKTRKSAIEIESYLFCLNRLKLALREKKLNVTPEIFNLIETESRAFLKEFSKCRTGRFRLRNLLKLFMNKLGLK